MYSLTTFDSTIPRAAQMGIGGLEPRPLVAAEPTSDYAWLQRLVGSWETEIEVLSDSGESLLRARGSETAELLGEFWLIADGRTFDWSYTSRLTVGYDAGRQHYVGTWIDSSTSFLWNYRGIVDRSLSTLTLDTSGPFPPESGGMTRFRDVMQFLSADRRQFTSSRLDRDGTWRPHLRIVYRRQR